MHIYFSGIGGTGIGPLAVIAKMAGYEVSGSDKQASAYIDYLHSKGIPAHVGQKDNQFIKKLHAKKPIDWFVYSSALPIENPQHPELLFVQENQIKHTKRDAFLAHFLSEKNLKLIAFAGTHGKTSSTAMAIWVARQLGIPVSYSVGAKLSFGDMGTYTNNSSYFLYECDEFDRNFLAFHPFISVLTKVDWDHHEQYPTRNQYIDAFKTFVQQSCDTYAHKKELDYLSLNESDTIHCINKSYLEKITLKGDHNRQNAAGVVAAMDQVCHFTTEEIIDAVNTFPGSNRRFEKIAPNIYTDYAHTPEEIAATLQLAKEYNQDIVVAYEPLTNRRQHYMINQYKDVFADLHALYWLPSYLAREDPKQRVISPAEFIKTLPPSAHATTATMNSALQTKLSDAAANGAIVLLLAGGGGGSLDEWARHKLATHTKA